MTQELIDRQSQVCLEIGINEIHSAFENKTFQIYYQPTVSLLKENTLTGVEACARINHEKYGVLSPGVFLPLINEIGLKSRLTRYLIKQALIDLNQWKELDVNLRVSINTPKPLFKDLKFVQWLKGIAENTEFDVKLLVLEISQNDKEPWDDELKKQLFHLKLKGFNFALDDADENLPDKEELKDVPIDEVKIHRSIVTEIKYQKSARQAVRNTIHLAKKIGARVVAVGVEKQEDANWLLEAGCHGAQGFLFGKPLAKDEFYSSFVSKEQHWDVQGAWDKPKILIVEDSDQYQQVFVEMLSELFETHLATNKDDAISLFESLLPEVLIVEAEFGDFSGEKLCEQLSATEHFKDCSVIFVSDTDSTESRMAAYQSGALDYLVKPILVTELISKICRVTVLQKKGTAIKNEIETANQFAKTSLVEASLYGSIVNFYRSLMHCDDEESLKQQLFNFMAHKQLRCSVQFRNEFAVSHFDQTNIACSPIEVNIFEVLRNKGRLYEFGRRLIVNFEHVSCLIKNMPEKEEESGMVRDYLSIVIEGLEARYRDLLRQRALHSVLDKLEALTGRLTQVVKNELNDKKELMDNLDIELQMSFHVLDLTEEQEDKITSIIGSMIESKDDSEINSLSIINNIEKITEELSRSVKNADSTSEDKPKISNAHEVELF
ncbi:EAL domain-containing protein [Aliikangiella coralliicola]|uniref:EAL domain-containing protein n=1 Tax=Aliikangiella coralliicola TaxID=2592383 RepID=A0A545UH78_9GAMM|nr:EAL domain-containing protein [Aliikangiella coralliicola]TQV88824.1 EAL domain-containing protein [Aliikangiella coralliicola]